MTRRGFTLIECLIGLALSLLAITAGLEFWGLSERTFRRLKAREEAGQATLAALDKIRIDLLHAGLGLFAETGLGLVTPVEVADGELRTAALERTLGLAADARAGDTRLSLVSTSGISAGRRVALRCGAAGEVRTITRIEAEALLLDGPLERAYPADSATVSLLELVACFRDGATRVLRRRVNASPAQPLLEDTAGVAWELVAAAPLVRIRLESAAEGVHAYETTVFLKNPALAGGSGT